MIVWLQSSFHKPSFIIWLRHHGDGIGRHNPFQIACHVISLQRHHVFVFQMVVDGNLVALPFWLNQIYGSDIEARISEKLLYKLYTDVLAGYFPSEDSLVFFSANESLSFTKIKWRTLSILSNTEFWFSP